MPVRVNWLLSPVTMNWLLSPVIMGWLLFVVNGLVIVTCYGGWLLLPALWIGYFCLL